MNFKSLVLVLTVAGCVTQTAAPITQTLQTLWQKNSAQSWLLGGLSLAGAVTAGFYLDNPGTRYRNYMIGAVGTLSAMSLYGVSKLIPKLHDPESLKKIAEEHQKKQLELQQKPTEQLTTKGKTEIPAPQEQSSKVPPLDLAAVAYLVGTSILGLSTTGINLINNWYLEKPMWVLGFMSAGGLANFFARQRDLLSDSSSARTKLGMVPKSTIGENGEVIVDLVPKEQNLDSGALKRKK